MWFYGLTSTASVIMTIRAVLIVTGIYKDPILASFEHYGEEKIFSPIVGLVMWGWISINLFLFLLLPTTLVVLLGFGVATVFLSVRYDLDKFMLRNQGVFRRFPHWYYELFHLTDREERRKIAYMWLHLPFTTRMLYNANTHFFKLWAEQVLLTIAR